MLSVLALGPGRSGLPTVAAVWQAGPSDAEDQFFDLHLSASGGFVSSKIYDRHNGFDFAFFGRGRVPFCLLLGLLFYLFELLECLVV